MVDGGNCTEVARGSPRRSELCIVRSLSRFSDVDEMFRKNLCDVGDVDIYEVDDVVLKKKMARSRQK